jgi:hypothetical protein
LISILRGRRFTWIILTGCSAHKSIWGSEKGEWEQQVPPVKGRFC